MVACLVCSAAHGRSPRAGWPSGCRAARKISTQILDTYVRDGLVYYRALKLDRGRLDAYVAALAAVGSGPAPEKRADRVLAERLQRARAADRHRPLSDRGAGRPRIRPRSIRQVPGAFERADAPGRPGARSRSIRSSRRSCARSTIRASSSRSAAARSEAVGFAARRSRRRALESAAVRGGHRVHQPGAVHPDRRARPTRCRQRHLLVARAAVRRRPTPTGAPPVFADRSPIERADSRLRPAEAAADRAGLPRERTRSSSTTNLSTGRSTT